MAIDRALIEMISSDPANIERLVKGVENAVQRSYDSDLRRDGSGKVVATRAEVKQRVRYCIEMARELRHDAKWSVFKIVDALPVMLRRKLDGQDWDPTSLAARASWFPDHIDRNAC